MGFVDPVTAFIRWGTFTVPAGTTALDVTHGAAFTPERVILFPKNDYAWMAQAIAYNYTGIMFSVVLSQTPAGDAEYEYVAGMN